MDETILSPAVRRTIYVALAVAGLALGATQVGFASIGAEQPTWLIAALSVYAYLAGGSGILATLNTRPAYTARHSPSPIEPPSTTEGADHER